ncbi:MAG TPA: MAPEG family protein [Myxococcales bacterium]|nr:MAPEG family protein [Myxococcales bacterium]
MPVKTALVAAPLFLLIAGLGLAISYRRRRERIGPGMQGDARFVRLQRAHGNAVEHVPLLLVGMLLLELMGGGGALVTAVGVAILVGRAAHAAGLIMRTRHPLHFFGAALTYTLEVLLGWFLLYAAAARG